MRFAHIADVHIGGWRDPRLSDVNSRAFERAVDICIDSDVEFVIIAGDLFNTPLPGIEKLKSAVMSLKKLKDSGIRVYGVPGSHDFSPSGKTIIDVLEGAGLFTNVCWGSVSDGKLSLKFVEDKTGVKITGMLGKKGMLDRKYYEGLDYKSLDKPGKKIFVFHTLLTELKPKKLEMMDSVEVSMLPKGFDYYAGGHPHIVGKQDIEGYGRVCYTGPLFPNSFSELEDLGHGGFYLVDDFRPEFVPVKMYDTLPIRLDCDKKSASEAEKEILENIPESVKNTIVMIRLFGTLSTGKASDIDYKMIFERLYNRGAYFVMKNTSRLATRDFEQIKVDRSIDVEEKLIKENLGKLKGYDEESFIKELNRLFSQPKVEGETMDSYKRRLLDDFDSVHDKMKL